MSVARRPKHRWRRATERLLTRCIAAVFLALVRPIPLSWVRRIGNVGGWILLAISAHRQRLADRNLIATFGDRFSRTERRRIRLAVAAGVAKMILELLKMPTLSREQIRETVPLHGAERLRCALQRGKGAIVVSGHYGNWEMMAARFAAEGHDMAVVARDASDANVASLINRCRNAVGVGVYGKDDLRGMIGHLRVNGVLGILPDQHANEGAIRLDFLGRPAWCAKGPALLALRTGCAVIPVFCDRLADGSLEARVLEGLPVTVTGSRDQDVATLMQRINDVIGEQIRAHPEQWLWFHNRWKELRPEPAKPATD